MNVNFKNDSPKIPPLSKVDMSPRTIQVSFTINGLVWETLKYAYSLLIAVAILSVLLMVPRLSFHPIAVMYLAIPLLIIPLRSYQALLGVAVISTAVQFLLPGFEVFGVEDIVYTLCSIVLVIYVGYLKQKAEENSYASSELKEWIQVRKTCQKTTAE